MKKSRIVIRRKMKTEKKAMHKLEAEQQKLREEIVAHTGKTLGRPCNFHRTADVVLWNAPKRVQTDWMNCPRAHKPKMRRIIADGKEQLRENEMVTYECESDSVETGAVIVERPMPKVPVQRKIRPGGRVERLMKRLEQERMMEDLANAREFAKAVCEMHINPKVIDAQKSGNV